jgi:hypothetical protein
MPGMVNPVLASCLGAALQAYELHRHAFVIEQPNDLGIDERKQVQIDLVLGLLARLKVNARLLALLRGPVAIESELPPPGSTNIRVLEVARSFTPGSITAFTGSMVRS